MLTLAIIAAALVYFFMFLVHVRYIGQRIAWNLIEEERKEIDKRRSRYGLPPEPVEPDFSLGYAWAFLPATIWPVLLPSVGAWKLACKVTPDATPEDARIEKLQARINELERDL